jgi:hypothetical protein
MQGIISFHPVDLGFFDKTVEPLVAGEKVNPESYLNSAVRVRTAGGEARRYKLALELQLESLEPPPPPSEGSVWDKVRTRLERFDYKPDPLAKCIADKIEPDLQLHGRPFLITEGSTDRVVSLVDEYAGAANESAVNALILEQLVRIDPALGRTLEPVDTEPFSAEMIYRRELLALMKILYDLPQAARHNGNWGRSGGETILAAEALPEELPWLAVYLHSRVVPFWIGRNVDGLDTVCRAAGVEPPGCLSPAWRLFARSCEEFGGLREALGFELRSRRGVGAFVPPEAIPDLLSFLSAEGSRMIQAASQHGEGPTCATLLRKIRECARYAEGHGMGYLEASGILPVDLPAAAPSPGSVSF